MITWLLDRVAQLPTPILRGAAALLGDLWFFGLRVRRGVALDNVTGSALDPGPPARRSLVRRSCRNLVLNVLELPRWVVADRERFDTAVEVAGGQHLRAAHAEGRGVVVVTAHLGNWELLGAAARRLGLPTSLVVRPLAGSRAQRWVAEQRRRSGVRVIEEGCGQLGAMSRALGRGDIVGLTVDQRPHRGGVPATFLGRSTHISRTAASLALRTNAPLVVVTIHRRGSGHRVEIQPPLRFHRDGRPVREQAAALARAYGECIERAIAEHPDQWLWHHRRFVASAGAA
ncbi:MAG: lysophospholipid acyltransferase family protein [Myxococcota bacterium]|nr:lysophospholipid acyltransferase family protein [Myxococcota bacterium]